VRPLFSLFQFQLVHLILHQIQRVNERARDKGLRLSTRVRKSPRPVGWGLPLLSTITFQKTLFRCAPQNVNMIQPYIASLRPQTRSPSLSPSPKANGHVANGHGSPMNGSTKRSRSPVARVELPGATIYDDSYIDREEYVRLVIQSLRDIGYMCVLVVLF
jgi:hypothetical protein